MSTTTTTTPKAKAPKKPLAERIAAFQERKAKAAIRAAFRNAQALGAQRAVNAYQEDSRAYGMELPASVEVERDALMTKLALREDHAVKASATADAKWSRVADAAGPQPKRTKDEKAAELAAILSSLDPETRAKFAALGVKAKAK